MTAHPPRSGLHRVLGTVFGLAVTLGVTVGVGILRTPGEIAARLPDTGLYLTVWIAGGVYALFAALSLAELGAMLPRSGGQYVAARHTFGPYAGFVVGWSDWLATCGTAAAVAIVLGEYAGMLIPPLAGRAQLVGVLAAAGLLLVQLRGTRWGGWAQAGTTLIKTLGFGTLIVACLALGTRAPSGTLAPMPGGFALTVAVIAALQGVLYTYDGWNGALYFAGEMRDPGRDMPRSMIGGVLAVIAVYLLVNLAFLRVLGIGGMAGDALVASSAAGAVFGATGSRVIALLVVVTTFSALSANLLMAPRVLYALGGDGLAASGTTQVNQGGTPTIAALTSGAVAVAFIVSGTFNSVLAVLAFLFVLAYVISLSAVFVLRRREPDAVRPYRAWGYPFTTGVALLGSVAFLTGALVTDPSSSAIAVALVALSYPVYRWLDRAR